MSWWPEVKNRTVGDIGLLHLPLVVKGWIHSLLHIWLSQCEHTKGVCNPLLPVYCLLLFMHRVGKFVSTFVPPPSPQADLLNWLTFTAPSNEELVQHRMQLGSSSVRNWVPGIRAGMPHGPTHTCRQSHGHCCPVYLPTMKIFMPGSH